MKNFLLTATLLGVITTTVTAFADNVTVENALKKRPDLSSFYKALHNTGVDHELRSGVTYTVFAPQNSAFDKISQDKYPCFYTEECRAQAAAIVRNHIVAGSVYIEDAAKEKGGLYSISGRFVNVSQQSKNSYAVDGNRIVYASEIGTGMLYKIDGVIADARELSAIPYEKVITTTQTTPDPTCPDNRCPDEVSETTTIITTTPIAYRR